MNANEPAYPIVKQFIRRDGAEVIFDSFGMTKRELIAAMMLQGLLQSHHSFLIEEKQTTLDGYSQVACNFADALITQLNKTKP